MWLYQGNWTDKHQFSWIALMYTMYIRLTKAQSGPTTERWGRIYTYITAALMLWILLPGYPDPYN